MQETDAFFWFVVQPKFAMPTFETATAGARDDAGAHAVNDNGVAHIAQTATTVADDAGFDEEDSNGDHVARTLSRRISTVAQDSWRVVALNPRTERSTPIC